ncbi:hypothetical protein HDV00_005240 [Rhizophlyctis rosea]|nr:hypothetical protein HDV00_005240 [Rhizophlyctis rosea]
MAADSKNIQYEPLPALPAHFRAEDIKIICCDIDGTTLTSSHTISPYTLETFHLVREQRPDINMMFATGRPRIATKAIRAAMQELGHAVGIYVNGALCGSEDTSKPLPSTQPSHLDFHVLHETPLSPQDAVWYTNWAVVHHRPLVLYSYDETIPPFDHPSCALTAGASEPYPTEIPHDTLIPKLLSSELRIHKAIFMDPKQPLDKTLTDLLADPNLPRTTTSFLRNTDFALEVVTSETSKANALEFFTRQHAGCTLKNVIAFGDGDNDVEMIREVGMGVAMGNGLPQVKTVADYIAPTNDEDGLARVLRTLLGL